MSWPRCRPRSLDSGFVPQARAGGVVPGSGRVLLSRRWPRVSVCRSWRRWPPEPSWSRRRTRPCPRCQATPPDSSGRRCRGTGRDPGRSARRPRPGGEAAPARAGARRVVHLGAHRATDARRVRPGDPVTDDEKARAIEADSVETEPDVGPGSDARAGHRERDRDGNELGRRATGSGLRGASSGSRRRPDPSAGPSPEVITVLVNLLWLVPGVVGGSEESTTDALPRPGGRASRRPRRHSRRAPPVPEGPSGSGRAVPLCRARSGR